MTANAPELVVIRRRLSDSHSRLRAILETAEDPGRDLETAINQLGHSIHNLESAAKKAALADAEREADAMEAN